MDVQRAIRERRSIGKVKPELPPKEHIEALLEAATWAPNHHRVEPWKFFVLTGKSRERLGEIFARIDREKLDDPNSPEAEDVTRRAIEKPLRAPVVIAVAVDKTENPRVVDIENVEAVAAAVQNMLLEAHALGLGAMWRTGGYAYDPRVKAFFGLSEDQVLVAFVYVGYPAIEPPPAKREAFSEKTVWWGDQEGGYDAP